MRPSSKPRSEHDRPGGVLSPGKLGENTKIETEFVELAPTKSQARRFARIGEYAIGHTLGEGAYGKVKHAVSVRTGKEFAMKFMDLASAKPHVQRVVAREVAIMKMLSHANVVHLYEVLSIDGGSGQRGGKASHIMGLVMEFVPGGELFDFIVQHGRLSEQESRRLTRQLVSALDYCHSLGVVHRDIKPENLLLDANRDLKLTDFGLANLATPGQLLQTYCGSVAYCAPEVLMQTPYIGEAVDVWSVGVMLYAMASGTLPWDGESLSKQIAAVLHEPLDLPSYFSPGLCDLVTRILVRDPTTRCTLQAIRVDPWLTEGFDGPPPSALPDCPELALESLSSAVVARLVGIGIEEESLHDAIRRGDTTAAPCVMYHVVARYLKQRDLKSALKPVGESTPNGTTESDPTSVDDILVPANSSSGQSAVARSEEHRHKSPQQDADQSNRHRRSPASSRKKHVLANEEMVVDAPSSVSRLPGESPRPTAPSERSRVDDRGVASHAIEGLTDKRSRPRRASVSGSQPKNVSAPNSPTSSRRRHGMNNVVEDAVGRSPGAVRRPRSIKPEEDNSSPHKLVDKFEAIPGDLDYAFDGEAIRLPVCRGAFPASISAKLTKEVAREVAGVLKALRVSTKVAKKRPYTWVCKEKGMKVRFEVAIVRVAGFDNMRGVIVKHAGGDLWKYQAIYQHLVQLWEQA